MATIKIPADNLEAAEDVMAHFSMQMPEIAADIIDEDADSLFVRVQAPEDATETDVAELLEEIPDGVLRCRTRGGGAVSKKTGTTFTSDIVLGDRYLDEQTGFEGVATAVYFFQYGCERVNLEAFDESTSQIRSIAFDSPRLTHIETGQRPKVAKTGGPGLPGEGRADISARDDVVR